MQLERKIDPFLKSALYESDYWCEEISLWIKFIKENGDLLSSELLKKATSISMGLNLTDDETIRDLNWRWRKKLETTDVLAFSTIDGIINLPQGNCLELSDIVVSVTTAHRQALEQNHGLGMELRWLVCHGLLHLLGWDHPDNVRLNEMLDLQHQLLKISDNLLIQEN